MWRVQTITVPLRKLSKVGQTGQRQENYREILPRDAFSSVSFQQRDLAGLEQFCVNLCQGRVCTNKQGQGGFFFFFCKKLIGLKCATKSAKLTLK